MRERSPARNPNPKHHKTKCRPAGSMKTKDRRSSAARRVADSKPAGASPSGPKWITGGVVVATAVIGIFVLSHQSTASRKAAEQQSQQSASESAFAPTLPN